MALLVKISTIVSGVFKKAGLGFEVLEWLVNEGQEFFRKKIAEIVAEYKKLNLKLQAVNVFKGGETYLEGTEFIRRAKEEVLGWETGDQRAYEYFKNPAHWAEIPYDFKILVFVNTEFDSGDCRHARYLYRGDTEWEEGSFYFGHELGSDCRVAVITSPITSSLDFGPKVS